MSVYDPKRTFGPALPVPYVALIGFECAIIRSIIGVVSRRLGMFAFGVKRTSVRGASMSANDP
jgi:hypothetical protein